ncbi:MAG: response regulator, partial [Oscillospiraceae bacterium]|nr:response regulator [Oscillospiraceae bacterium]
SAAGTIGADSLMNYARELEGAAKEKNLNLIQSKSGDFCKKLTALLHEIKPFTSTELGSNSAASPLPDDSKMKAGRQSNKQKIVIIDDTVSVLKLMQDALKDDYDVLTNKDARKALEIINKATPDLIILDLIMPDISGFDVLKQLKSSEVTGSIPVVIASGRDNDDEIAKCYDLGAVDVIRKPFVLSVFKRRIDFNMQFVSMKNKLSLEQSSDFL